MGAPQYEQAGADIGGTGTTNTIPRWTGPSTLGDSGLIDNGTAIYTTTRNVGIGTASPVAGGLTVYGASNGQVFVQNSSGHTRLLQNGTDFYIDGNVSGSAGNIIFRRGSGTLESARIDSSGNFSIGYTGGSWSSTYTGMFLNRGLSFMARDGGDAYLSANAIYDSSNAWKYVASGSTASTQIALQSGATVFSRAVAGTAGSALTWLESARIDSSGRWYVGVASVSPASSGIWAIINQPGGAGGQEWHNSTGSQGGAAIVPSQDRATWYVYSGSVGSEVYKQSCAFTPTGIDLTGASATPGIKLPNAPLNTDPNTLDSYREGTRVLAAGDLSGWTYVTATQYWTLVGRTVTLHTVFTGGTSSATGGATIATPPLLTPLRIAAGAAVNSSGTALGNGVCVVASTSSTTGTVITSNAISSSAVDKVLTVTYETAGL